MKVKMNQYLLESHKRPGEAIAMGSYSDGSQHQSYFGKSFSLAVDYTQPIISWIQEKPSLMFRSTSRHDPPWL